MKVHYKTEQEFLSYAFITILNAWGFSGSICAQIEEELLSQMESNNPDKDQQLM